MICVDTMSDHRVNQEARPCFVVVLVVVGISVGSKALLVSFVSAVSLPSRLVHKLDVDRPSRGLFPRFDV